MVELRFKLPILGEATEAIDINMVKATWKFINPLVHGMAEQVTTLVI